MMIKARFIQVTENGARVLIRVDAISAIHENPITQQCLINCPGIIHADQSFDTIIEALQPYSIEVTGDKNGGE
jgi:hypothetical protein